MLTPAKIKNHHFDAAGRNSYKADSVDTFFEEVAQSYEKMFQENGEMFKKLNLLAERLEEYRKDEDNIRNALLTAQRMSETITNEAKEKAESLINAATERANTENARLDAIANDVLSQAQEKANALLAAAQEKAAQIIDDATRDSKEAAISARSAMIKEEAALDTMKQEVTKLKALLLDSYKEQIALVEKLPEFIYEQAAAAEAEEEVEEPVQEPETATEPEVTEVPEVEPETEAEAEEEAEAVPAMAEVVEEVTETVEEVIPEAEKIDVDTLQQMIADSEDTEAGEEEEETEETVTEPVSDAASFILPEIDEETDEDLDRIVDLYEAAEEEKEETNESPSGDIFFTKPKKTEVVEEAEPAEVNNGFSLNFENISSYSDEIEDDENVLDDDLDNDDEGFASKFKGFFKK